MQRYNYFFLLLVLLCFGCSDENPGIGETPDDFDRTAMLAHWADELIIPAFQAFQRDADALAEAAVAFDAQPDAITLTALRSAWEQTSLSWQSVSMFEVGPAESVNLRNQLNLYPTDTALIQENSMRASVNLALPSNTVAQGLPALDYLLHGIKSTDASLLDFYNSDANANNYKGYVVLLAGRIAELAAQVTNEWQGDYRNSFVANNGNSANASLDRLVNDYIFYYEKWLRAGKIGIPAGIFSATPLPDRVEAYYRGDFSKTLFVEGLDAAQRFFNGEAFSKADGPGLADYLDYLNTVKDGADLSQLINNQFEEARQIATALNANFAEQVRTDNSQMLRTYDALQANVVLLKVDMLQALNINVDFIDADGD